MFLDKSLNIALLISAIFHTVVFLPLPHFKNLSVQKKAPPLKVTYLAPKKISPRKPLAEDKPHKLVKQVNKKDAAIKAEVKKDKMVKPKDKPVKRKIPLAEPPSQYAKIEIPLELPKEQEALYLNYYQSIREKIRTFVVENYPRFIACGEVCLYFVLSSKGGLKEISVIEKRSSPNRLLREIAEKSLRDASPFLPFPEELNQPQLSFNVIISFELEN